MKSIFLPCLSALMLVAGAGVTQAQVTNNNYSHGTLSERDYKFVKAAAQGGKMEVTLGQIATQTGQDPAVRDFGTRMVRDHQAANQELVSILSQKGAAVSDEPGMMDAHMIKHLQSLSGSEFDRVYIKNMVSDHKKDIKEFQKEADNGDDVDLKNFASKTLPTLQDHLRMAQDAQSKLSTSASK